MNITILDFSDQAAIAANSSSLRVHKEISLIPQVSTKLGQFRDKNLPPFHSLFNMPDWAYKHIESHKKLKAAIHDLREMGINIPSHLTQALQKSQKAMNRLIQVVDYSLFLKTNRQSETNFRYWSLMTPLKTESPLGRKRFCEWELNFSLLYSAYNRTKEEDIKSKIRFLMVNYLAKTAFLNGESLIPLTTIMGKTKYQNMLQLGQCLFQGGYQRTMGSAKSLIEVVLNNTNVKILGSPEEESSDFMLLDTLEVQELYPVSFHPIFLKLSEEEDDCITHVLVEQFKKYYPNFFNSTFPINLAPFSFPILIDATELIHQSLITNNSKILQDLYLQKQKRVKDRILNIIKEGVEILKKEYPNNPLVKLCADLLLFNTAVVSRAKINNHLAVLGFHNFMFLKSDFNNPSHWVTRHNFLSERLIFWAELTGTSIGAVKFRQALAERYIDPIQMIQHSKGDGQIGTYAVFGKSDSIMFAKPKDLLRNLLQTLEHIGQTGELNTIGVGRAQQILAHATASMLKTLFTKIPEEIWIKKQEDPAIQELTQIASYRLLQHLGTAIHQINHFRRFSQAIERVHAECTTFLLFFSPFDEHLFDEQYKRFLEPIFPENLRPSNVGIAKSAMNVFAGTYAAVLKNNPNAVIICEETSYYEKIEIFNEPLSFKKALLNPDLKKIDFYIDEFYHNVIVSLTHTHYKKGEIIDNIKTIFNEKPDTDQLTVALDTTIDLPRSQDVKLLLETFQKEIEEGKLNIVVFRSGQKFDMLGLDHYFGCLFYTVNNGDKKWEGFNRLKVHKVHRTDDLSIQYFSWLMQSDPSLIEGYTSLLFENTRQILDLVPPTLRPEEGKDIFICDVDQDVKVPFIDCRVMKIEDRDEIVKWLRQRFTELFMKEDKLVYHRASFGFFHPNLSTMMTGLRITPGLDPDDIRIYQTFFRELEEKIQSKPKMIGEALA